MEKMIRLIDSPEMRSELAEWFHEKWGIPVGAYLESMDACLSGKNAVPQWYGVLDGQRIIAGIGVIENDFHDRRDLAPNVCAVYVEEEFRGRGIAGRMLSFVVEDMKARGIDTLYLVTEHMGFYERYGWEFFCMAKEEGGEHDTRVYMHKT